MRKARQGKTRKVGMVWVTSLLLLLAIAFCFNNNVSVDEVCSPERVSVSDAPL